MASEAELKLLLSARDTASTVVKAFAGVLGGAVVGALSDAARAAAADAANTVKLQVAVENAGNSYEQLEPIIAQRIKHGQDLAFTDDQVRDSLTALTQTTGSFTKAMELQQLAMDLSRAKGMDLTTASELIGKVAEGNTGILKRYGVVLADGATATDALAALQKKFGGQAEAYGKTTSAAIFKVKDSIDEWKESIGAALGPAGQIVAMLPGMSAGFSAVTAALALLTPAQIAYGKAALASVAPMLLVIATGVLVVEAFLQVKETIELVTDNWDLFVRALMSGQLNDIPIFGFFFRKAQEVIGMVQGLIGAWQTLMSILGQAQTVAAPGGPGSFAGERGRGYAEGTDYVPATGYYKLHQGEAVITANQNRGGMGGGITIIFPGNVYGMQDFEDKVSSIFRDRRLAGGFRGVS